MSEKADQSAAPTNGKSKLAARRASLRCPGCSAEVFLPAAACPECGFDFREGRRPAPPPSAAMTDEAPSRRIYYLAGAGALVLILILGWVIFGGRSSEPPQIPEAASSGGGVLIQVPASNIQNPLLNPAKTIQTSKGVADQADDRVRQMELLQQGNEGQTDNP